jgi:hypothetical protein
MATSTSTYHTVHRCAFLELHDRLVLHYRSSREKAIFILFGWLVADDWCWFVLREEYCWLVAGGWFVVREKYYWLVADKPIEQGGLS